LNRVRVKIRSILHPLRLWFRITFGLSDGPQPELLMAEIASFFLRKYPSRAAGCKTTSLERSPICERFASCGDKTLPVQRHYSHHATVIV
ncbi:MAG: hypothetical protein KGH84_00935, partial [Paracoccaceae bacterium]|nr:hypothetical protein [Paracoccaceae bacterium]